jgi:hypothetical protein
MLFAAKNAKRHRGEYNLNDLLAAEAIAAQALAFVPNDQTEPRRR